MLDMKRQRPLLIALFLICVSATLVAGDKKDSEVSTLRVAVIKDDNGKPVRNAAVVLHPVGRSGKQSRGGIELKTDAEGKTSMDGMPYGLMRIQVIATGFQTYGLDYTINQPEQDLTIRLKRPQGQYSIYENHSDTTTAAPAPDKQQH
jgi:hypothetical protein